MEENTSAYGVLVGEKLVERDHLEDLRVDGRITINCILKWWAESERMEFIWHKTGANGWLL